MDRTEAREAGHNLLGDRLAAGLKAVGADRVAKVYARVTGKSCGCEKRTALLNEWDQKRRIK